MAGALLAGAVAAPIVGGILGANASRADREAASQAIANATAYVNQLKDPPRELVEQILLKEFKAADIYKPEMEKDIIAAASAISPKTEGRDAQLRTIKAFEELAKTGYSSADRYAIDKMRGQIQGDTQAALASIRLQEQARGQGGSQGSAYASLLSAAQGGANRENESGLGYAAQFANARQQALRNIAESAGNLQQADTGLATNVAQIQNDMNRFNVQNRVGIQQRNIAAASSANQYNLANLQDISNKNTQAYNDEQKRIKDAYQTLWSDDLQRRTLQANTALGAGSRYGEMAKNTMDSYQTAAGGASSAMGTGAKMYGPNNTKTG